MGAPKESISIKTVPTSEFDPESFSGLTSAEAAERLKEDGFNELASAKPRHIFRIALDVVREPMFLLLVACGVIYLLLGKVEEALILLAFVFVVVGITFYQERKTERALEALRDLSSPRAMVFRDSEPRRIAGREVVRDDILVLSEGDRVPADALLLSTINLTVDESLLTGESAPVRKRSWDGKSEMGRPGGDDLPFVYSGSMVVQGMGVARVQATGGRTELGKIGKALQSVESERTPLQKETGRLVRNIAVVGLSLCAVIVVVYGLSRSDWLHGILAGITLAMALLPEEFPVVLSIFLALGAWRISKRQVLTRRVPTVETLGSATVLCVDKTGTLTLNRMSARKLYADGEFYEINDHPAGDLPETLHELAEFSILASKKNPLDPMEKALHDVGERFLANTEHLHDDWIMVREYPLSQELLALSHVWKSPTGDRVLIAAKGAPEAIADLCHFDRSRTEELNSRVQIMSSEGLRILGVAKAYFTEPLLPGEQHDFQFEFVGLVGFVDPIRPSVPAAMQECYQAGMRVIMITGDYPGTAQSVARDIGLSPRDQVITGSELDLMDDALLQTRIRTVNIFARVVPEQKLRIVNALKANSEIVAMTGDGVNDAPALKSAHIGVAMGERGTDVAREAASLVLLDDDFSSIIQAVKLGRRIFDNLRKAMAYILAVHVPIAGMSLLPVLFGWPLVLFPVHIAFLELIIDPACSTVFEAESEEANVMKRPPRASKEPLFGRQMVGLSLLQGLSVLVIVFGVYVIALKRGGGATEARTLTFTTLIIANLGLILTNRSWTKTIVQTLRERNRALWWVLGGAILFLALALYTPLLRKLFDFAILHPLDLLICLSAGAISIMWFEGLKFFRHKKEASIY